MKKSILIFLLLTTLNSLANADQKVIYCDLDLPNVYSIKIMRGPAGYYAEIIHEYFKKSIIPVPLKQVQNKDFDLPTLKKTRLLLKSFKGSWYSKEIISSSYEVSGLAECQ